jgi:hypothetical protein
MNAATLNRFVKSGALIASAAIVAAIASLINVQAAPSSEMPVYELPRVVVTAKRATIVELPRVVVTGHRVSSTDGNVAARAASKSDACG